MENLAKNTQKPITEDEIKRAVVPFLRHFYKYRYSLTHHGSFTDFDLVSEAGQKIDTRLNFLKENGDPVVVAVECTSVDKLEEVKFRLNRPYFLWECAAATSLILSVIYLFLIRYRGFWVYNLGWQGNFGMFLGLSAVVFSAFFWALRGRKKFRYIYAVEQFNSYHADEKWVALAENAFPNSKNIYFRELRKQLIFNSLGLLLVADDGTVRPIVTPSRIGSYGSRRRTFDFFLQTNVGKKLEAGVTSKPAKMAGNVFQKIWEKVHGRLFETKIADPTNRFMQSFFHQKMLVGLGLMVLGIVFWRVKTYEPEHFLSETKIRKDSKKTKFESEEEWFMGSDYVQFDRFPEEYLPPDAPKSEFDLSGMPVSNSENDSLLRVYLQEIEAKKPEKIASKSLLKTTKIGCANWQGVRGFLVQDNFFENYHFALARRDELKKNGFSVTLAPRICLFDKEFGGWVTLLGGVFSDEKSAEKARAIFQKKIIEKQLERKPILVRKIKI